MEASDQEYLDDLIWYSKFGFSLDNLSLQFKINVHEVVQALAQIVSIKPNLLKWIMMRKQNGISLEEISDLCEIDIDCLKMFLAVGRLSIDWNERIKESIASGFSKHDFITQLSQFNAANKISGIEHGLSENETNKQDVAKKFYSKGVKCLNKKLFDKAEEMFMESLRIHEEVLPCNQELADTYFDIGDQLKKCCLNDKAEKMFLKCIRIYKQILPPYNEELARVYFYIGDRLIKCGHHDRAKEMFMSGLQIYEEVYSPDDISLAEYFFDVGGTLFQCGLVDMAEETLMKCLSFYEEYFPSELAMKYYQTGEWFHRFSLHDKAEVIYIKCLRCCSFNKLFYTSYREGLLTVYKSIELESNIVS